MCYGLCDYEDRYGEPLPGCKTNKDSCCAKMNGYAALEKELKREPTEQEFTEYMDTVYGSDQ